MAAQTWPNTILPPTYQPARGGLTDNQFVLPRDNSLASWPAFTKPKELSFVIPSDRSAQRILVTWSSDELPTWVKPAITAVMDIQALPENWDSYRGRKISRDLIGQSLSVLGQIMEVASPAPSVVPLADGGLQFEWHRKQQDLEIVFPADDAQRFFYQCRARGVEQEGLASDVKTLAELLRNIA